MKKEIGVRFLQSARDHPCMVHLGRGAPSWELNRWGRDSLRFNPVENEKYDLRGNSRYLLYKGRRESHRFTILDNEKFEYDIILKRPPQTNKLYLFIEGWEEFDFLRQPDTFGPEILRGSYAVYKKEFVISSRKYHVGTGKLCHIHRPMIWDAQGRKVWGDILIDKGVMVITIPEEWLGEAKCPITVDPIIGNNSVGAYDYYLYMTASERNWYDQNGYPENYEEEVEHHGIWLDEESVFNRVILPLPMQGNYDAYWYVNSCYGSNHYDEILIYPFLYNNATNNKPKNPLISATRPADGKVNATKPKGFRKGSLTVTDRINAGTSVWLGFSGYGGVEARFDYGLPYCHAYGQFYGEWDDDYTFNQFLEETDMDDLSNSRTTDELTPGHRWYNASPGFRSDFKVSMYLEIKSEAFARTITQGVKLSDTRTRKHDGKRVITQNTNATQTVTRVQSLFRKNEDTTIANTLNARYWDSKRAVQDETNAPDLARHEKGMFRIIQTTLNVLDIGNCFRTLCRKITELTRAYHDLKQQREIHRNIADTITQTDTADRTKGFIALLQSVLGLQDTPGYIGQWGRNVEDGAYPVTNTHSNAGYLRELRETPDAAGETSRIADYIRLQQDTGNVVEDMKRMLTVFIKLFSVTSIRDYIINRFLKSREEIQIKSKVTREIIIDSKIH
jgi:hypothetical protein